MFTLNGKLPDPKRSTGASFCDAEGPGKKVWAKTEWWFPYQHTHKKKMVNLFPEGDRVSLFWVLIWKPRFGFWSNFSLPFCVTTLNPCESF